MTHTSVNGVFFTTLFIIFLLATRSILNKQVMSSKEGFIPAFSLLVDEKPDTLTLSIPKSVNTPNLSKKLGRISNIQITDAKDDLKSSLVVDAYSATNFSKTHQVLTVIDTEKVAYFMRSLDSPSNSKGFVANDIRIGYVNTLDNELIRQIFNAQKDNQTMSSYSLKQINQPLTINSKTFEDNGIDVLFVYEALDSDNMTKKIDKNMKLEVWDYAHTVDIHKIKVSLPLVKTKNIDFSMFLPQLKGKLDIVSSVLAFDNIIMINNKDVKNKKIATELQQLVHIFNKPEYINVYERYFPIVPIATLLASKKNDFLLQRDNRQILEQFDTSTKPFTFEPTHNVNGFYDSNTKRFYVYSDSIEGVPLKTGNHFILSKQVIEEHNAVYKVLAVGSKQSILEKVKDLTPTNKGNTPKPLSPGYLCYNRPDITSKASCESAYDIEGNKKKQRTYWDKPCEKHTDCPFYQANKNYQNYRGGCIDGRCEMPLGIQAVSYRLYDKDISKPICHNCKTPYCCHEQNDKSKYPMLNGPDYAFELDEFERPLQRFVSRKNIVKY